MQHLSEKGQKFFQHYAKRYEGTPGKKELLLKAAEAIDMADGFLKAMLADGLLTQSDRSGLDHRHPAFSGWKESNALALKYLVALGLQSEYHNDLGI